jgi:hypothetical protein
MVFEKRTQRREERAEKVRHTRESRTFGVSHGHADAGRAGLDRHGHAADERGRGHEQTL